MTREKKTYRVKSEDLEYIEKIKEERNLKYSSEALETIIREHKEDETLSIEERAKFFAKEIAAEISKELLSIRYSSREANKNSKITLELLNGIYIKKSLGPILPSTEIESEAFRDMKKYIEEDIKNKRVRKLYEEH